VQKKRSILQTSSKRPSLRFDLLSSLDCHTVFESYGAPEKRALQSNASQTHYVNVVRGDRSKVIPISCCRRKANVIRNGEKCGAL